MKDIVLVYAAPEPHTCKLPDELVDGIPMRYGTVIMCEECGIKYFARPFAGEFTGSWYYYWKQVRWYHFRIKKSWR